MNEAPVSMVVGSDPDDDPTVPVDLLLARRFHRDAGVAMMGHPVVAIALGILTWGLVPAWQVGAGVVGVMAATLARSLLHRRAGRHADDAAVLGQGTRNSTLVVAAAWGLTALLLLPG